MKQRRVPWAGAAGAAGLLAVLAWLAVPTSDDTAVPMALRHGPPQTKRVWEGPLAPVDGPALAAPSLRSPLPSTSGQPAPAAFAGVPITITAPQKLLVGEQPELLVSMGANADVSELSFTVQFDANVLQVRAGTEGGWGSGAGAQARFEADISAREDRVQIRSAASDRRTSLAGGNVAIVQFQGVAPGVTSVVISDVVAKDWAGRSVAAKVSASNLQVTVESIPPAESVSR